MSLTAEVGLLLTAGLLGFTHGIEPDHVAGVAALTHEAGSTRLSAVTGACFAAGHIVLVVLWVSIAYLLLDITTFSQTFKSLGLVVVGVVLAILSLLLGVVGMRKLIHSHRHDHGNYGLHAHVHLHLPSTVHPEGGTDEYVHDQRHEHSHTTAEFLKVGVIGALFTLSPPLSMIAFISATIAEVNAIVMAFVVLTYAVVIMVTMTAIASGVGALFGVTKARDEHVHAAAQLVAAVAIFGFGIHLLVENLPVVLPA